MIYTLFQQWNAGIITRMSELALPTLVDLDMSSNPTCLFGPQWEAMSATSAAPRIIFTPVGGSLQQMAPATPAFMPANVYQASIDNPWAWTDLQEWKVTVYGVSYTSGQVTPDINVDWDFSAAMLYAVVQTFHAQMGATWKPTRYNWIDSKSTSTKWSGYSRGVELFYQVRVPVLTFTLQGPPALASTAYTNLPSSATGTADVFFAGNSGADTIVIQIP